MPADRQLLNFIVEKDLLDRIDDFRFQNRFATRAGAIKWLLDWALAKEPSPARKPSSPKAAAGTPVSQDSQFVAPPAPATPVPAAAAAAAAPAPQAASNFNPEPSHESVIQALKSQGYEVGETAVQDGLVRIVVRSTDGSALVTVGQELHELAAGRLTLAQVAARRRRA